MLVYRYGCSIIPNILMCIAGLSMNLSHSRKTVVVVLSDHDIITFLHNYD